MRKVITHIMPVGAPWGGPEGFKFLSCFTSVYMYLERVDTSRILFCDRDIRICNRCGECGVTAWENKHHEQIYHGFLTLSGISCYTIWPKDYADAHFSDHPSAFNNDEYIQRTMDFAGYTYRILSRTSLDEMKKAIVQSIDNDFPVLAFNLVNDDWYLLTGYDFNGDTVIGKCTPENWGNPERKPDSLEDGLFSKSRWFNDNIRLLLITGRKRPRNNYAELFYYLKTILLQPVNTSYYAGLSAHDACIAALLDDSYLLRFSKDELTHFYTLIHIFIGVLAESRCFAAFAFWAGFFGRITDEARIKQMKMIGDSFMDTHNNCWVAWGEMGKDHICQPELYLDKFMKKETRIQIADLIMGFKENDKKAINVLTVLCTEC